MLPGVLPSHEPIARLLCVPADTVTESTRVELRLGLRNDSDSANAYRVCFYRDRLDAAHRIATKRVEIGAGAKALVQAWWPAGGQAGRHTILWTLSNSHIRQHGHVSLLVMHCRTRAIPAFQAGWIDPGALTGYPRKQAVTPADLRRMVEDMRRLGMRTVIVTYVEADGFFYPSGIAFMDRDQGRRVHGMISSFDVVGTILNAADRLGMHVFLGLGRGGDTPLLWQFDSPGWDERNQAAITQSKQVAGELYARYGRHRSLYGWYLTHEMDDLARASAYYNPVADYCHSLAPEMPVLAAPAGTPILDAQILQASHVDIFAYQDAVGSGYTPGRNTYHPEMRMAALDKLYSQYRQWHAGTDKHLWADLEIWEMDGSHGYSHSYPPSFKRVARQIALEAPFVEQLTAYEYTGFMESPRIRAKLRDRRAAALYRDYAAYLRHISK